MTHHQGNDTCWKILQVENSLRPLPLPHNPVAKATIQHPDHQPSPPLQPGRPALVAPRIQQSHRQSGCAKACGGDKSAGAPRPDLGACCSHLLAESEQPRLQWN
jgi:hypothetical protein